MHTLPIKRPSMREYGLIELSRTNEKGDKPVVEVSVVEVVASIEYVDDDDGVGLTLVTSTWTTAEPSVGN